MTAHRLVRDLTEAGLTVAVAESLTGGALVAHLIDVPGASAVVRGGIVAYATELKAELLGVDRTLLADRGPVDPTVARQMADGVRQRLGADIGIATTGVAGPAPQHGHAVGTIDIAVSTAERTVVRELRLAGPRAALRRATVLAALALLRGQLESSAAAGNNPGAEGVGHLDDEEHPAAALRGHAPSHVPDRDRASKPSGHTPGVP